MKSCNFACFQESGKALRVNERFKSFERGCANSFLASFINFGLTELGPGALNGFNKDIAYLASS